MQNLLFFDLETHEKTKKIQQIGAILGETPFRSADVKAFERFASGAEVVAGHNILEHDLPLLKKAGISPAFLQKDAVDTLLLSPLLFPKKLYHKLVKDYRLQSEFANDPVADAGLARDLFFDQLDAWRRLAGNVHDNSNDRIEKIIPAFDNLNYF